MSTLPGPSCHSLWCPPIPTNQGLLYFDWKWQLQDYCFSSSSKHGTAFLRLSFKTMPVYRFNCSLIGSVSAKEYAIHQKQLMMVNPWSWVQLELKLYSHKHQPNIWVYIVDKLYYFLQFISDIRKKHKYKHKHTHTQLPKISEYCWQAGFFSSSSDLFEKFSRMRKLIALLLSTMVWRQQCKQQGGSFWKCFSNLAADCEVVEIFFRKVKSCFLFI